MCAKAREKVEVISFKADRRLAATLNALENRSEFIRHALRAALDHRCPLCSGTGALDTDQQRHLRAFLQHHEIQECKRCHALHLDDKSDSPAAPSCPPPAPRKPGRASGRRRIGAVLTALFLGASLLAGAHRHAHDACDEHDTTPENHASHETCLTCVFGASSFLSETTFEISFDRLSFGARSFPTGGFEAHGCLLIPRSRAPPCRLT